LEGVLITVTGAEFNRSPSDVKRRAASEAVLVTEHGRPSVVVMSHAEYARLTAPPVNLAEWLEMPGAVEVEFPRLAVDIRAADL
jgi:prevent-host-death family protein